MSTSTIESHTATVPHQSASQRLRRKMVPMRLSYSWFGTRKSLSREQKIQAANAFGAEGKFLSAGKKLIDTNDPSFRAVTSIRGQATTYFHGISLPFPEAGVRLVREDDVARVNTRLDAYRQDLSEAVHQLEMQYETLRDAARERLGSLFDEKDYPLHLAGLFQMTWDHPNIEPPNYLRQLDPELYEQECLRVQARFDEAVQLAEASFMQELSDLVAHLSERLSGESDGRPKIFRDSAVTNLSEFFDRFRRLNIQSNGELDALVDRAKQVVQGVEPQTLRDHADVRRQISGQLAEVTSSLDQLLIDRPRRNILRRPK